MRNDFAHEVTPHFELSYDRHPLVTLNQVKQVTSQLVEHLYGESYQQIINLLNRIFSDTAPDDYSAASTAELIDLYQFEIDGGLFYNQQLLRELHDRGVDPEIAPLIEEFVTIDFLDDVGFGQADWEEFAIVQMRAVPFVPNAVGLEEIIPIELKIEYSSKSDMYKMPVPTPDKFEWYCYLMIDDRVVMIYPSHREGCPLPRKDSLDEKISIKFDHMFRDDGDHRITVGLQILNDSYRYHFILFETKTKVYGPFTT